MIVKVNLEETISQNQNVGNSTGQMISSTDKWQGKSMRARTVFRSKDLKVLLTTERQGDG